MNHWPFFEEKIRSFQTYKCLLNFHQISFLPQLNKRNWSNKLHKFKPSVKYKYCQLLSISKNHDLSFQAALYRSYRLKESISTSNLLTWTESHRSGYLILFQGAIWSNSHFRLYMNKPMRPIAWGLDKDYDNWE